MGGAVMGGMDMGFVNEPSMCGEKTTCPQWMAGEQLYNCENFTWIYTIFAMNRTLDVLYYSYPVSWLITLTAHVITYVIIFRLRSRNQANVAG